MMVTMLVTMLVTPWPRDEAEEADHERHRKKMERVAERRKANWEKKAKVSWREMVPGLPAENFILPSF